MRITIHKRLLAILMAAVLLASAAVGVSAENYVDILDSGIWLKTNSYTVTELVRPIQSTSSLGSVKGELYFGFEIPMQKNFTYNLVLEFTNVGNTKLLSPETDVLLADSAIGTLPTVVFDGAVITYSYENTDSGYHHTYNILFNWSGLDSNKWIYFLCKDVFHSFQINNLGLYCVYDPGGSYYEKAYADYLSDIRDQLHAGDDYTPPTSAATDLNNSLTSLDSAEASLSSKAEELRTAGSATMSSAISAAQDLPNKIGASTTFLATTFTRFWEAVPEEVTAVLLVCAAILFAGWLIGRIQ